MNRYDVSFFIILFSVIHKGLGDGEDLEFLKPKIISHTQMLLDKSFVVSCKTRIPAKTPFCFFWLYENDENTTPNTVQQTDGYEIDTIIEAHLTITNVKRSHEAKYICVLISETENNEEASLDVLDQYNIPESTCTLLSEPKDKIKLVREDAYFEVLDKFHVPKFDPPSKWHIITKDESLFIQCSGMAELEWKKMAMPPTDPYSKQELEPVRGTQEFSKVEDENHSFMSTLRIENMQPQDTGNYTCVYKSGYSLNMSFWEMDKYNLFRNFYVFVEDAYDLYVKTPTIIMGQLGSPLTIPCRPTFPEVDVFLYKLDDDKLLSPQTYESNVNYELYPEAYLKVNFSKTDGFTIPVLTNFYKSMAGYSCIFQFEHYREKLVFELLMKPSPYSLVQPTMLNFRPSPKIDDRITLICHMPFVKYQPIKMEWKMIDVVLWDTVEISEMTIIKMKHYAIAEIKATIARFNGNHRGQYICAVNGQYNLHSESKIYLDSDHTALLKSKPKLSGDGLVKRDRYTVKKGDSLALICWSSLPILWKRSFMDVPEFDITANLINFDRSLKKMPLLPLPKRGQAEIPLSQYHRSFTYDETYEFVYRIKLTNLTEKDAGFYSCMFANKELENEDMYVVSLKNRTDVVYIYIEGCDRLDIPSVTEITGVQNNPIVIPCQPIDPATKMNLYKDNTKVPENQYKYEWDSGFILTDTKNIGMKEQYVCELQLREKISKVTYTVSAIPSPEYLETPLMVAPKYRTMIGTAFSLSCTVTTPLNLPFSFNMIHPRINIYNDQRINIVKSSSQENGTTVSKIIMTIDSLKAEDEGNYMCEVRDLLNHTEADYYFLDVFDTVEVSPVIEPNEKTIQLNAGEDLHLKCRGSLSQVAWYKTGSFFRPRGDVTLDIGNFLNFGIKLSWLFDDIDEKRSTQTTSTDVSSDLPYSNDLILKSVTFNDVGYYDCIYDDEVTLQIGDPVTLLKQKRGARIYLFVKDNENFFAPSPTNLKFKINTNLVIPCKPSSQDITTELYKAGIKISEANHSSVNVKFNNTEGFLVSSRILFHSNEFQCEFTRMEGGSVRSMLKDIYADRIPDDVFIPRIHSKVMSYNNSFEITCSVICLQDTVLRLEWLEYPTKEDRDGTFIVISTDSINFDTNTTKKVFSTLKISNPNAHHQGLFKCKMEDIYGNSQFIEKSVKIYDRIDYPPIIIPKKGETYINSSKREFPLLCHGDRVLMWKVHSKEDRPLGDVTRKAESLRPNKIYKDETGLSPPPLENSLVENQWSIPRERKYVSFLTTKNINYMDTGFFTCIYEEADNFLSLSDMESAGKAARIYVYINDTKHIFKPVENNTIFYITDTVFTIPCLPTSRDVVVDLYSDNRIISKDNPYISYNPWTGFTVYNDSVLNIDKPIKCSFQKTSAKIQFQEFFLVKTPKKYRNQEVKVYRQSLNVIVCETKLYKKVPYSLSWTFPNKNVEKRANVEKNCTTNELFHECQLVMTIEKLNLTDSGHYVCNRMDVFSHIESADINLFVTNKTETLAWRLLLQAPGQMFCGKVFGTIGDREADPGEYPWIARVGFHACHNCEQVEYLCVGNLIGEQFVLTTGYCVEKPYKDALPVIRLGDHSTSSPDFPNKYQIINGIDVAVHPNYRTNATFFDVAVIILQHTVKFDYLIYPICLPRKNNSHIIYRSKKGYEVAGWGLLEESFIGSTSEILLKATIQLHASNRCNRYMPAGFCGRHISKQVIPCFGNSGSPVMSMEELQSNYLYFLAGITSMGKSARCLSPRTYQNVSFHLDFILASVEYLYNNNFKGGFY